MSRMQLLPPTTAATRCTSNATTSTFTPGAPLCTASTAKAPFPFLPATDSASSGVQQ